jgi:hypothetical protein
MNQMADLFQRHHNYAPMLGPLEDWPAGSPEWAERLGFRIKLGIENIEEQGIDRLIPWIQLALDTEPHPWEVWPADRPCLTPDRYFDYAAGIYCPDLADLIAAYKGRDFSLVRRLRGATAEGERQIAEQNELRGKAADPDVGNTRVSRPGSTNTAYLLRRLASSHPDILAAYERGEYATPTAAARAAGFKVDTPPLTKLRRAWKRASADERETFIREVT